MKTRMLKVLCLFLLASVLMVACQESAEPEAAASDAGASEEAVAGEEAASDEAETEKKDTVIIAALAEPSTLDSVEQNYLMSKEMNELTYNTLFKIDMDMVTQPDLVESYENVSDTEWVFTLHPDIRFHDGTDLTSEDVKATLDFVMASNIGAQFVTTIDSVEVVDDLTFKVITKEPTTRLLLDFTATQTSILPKELIEAGNDFNTNPIGSGPYKLVSWTPGDELVFEMNEDYFDKENMPTIKNMIWKIIPEGSSRTIALQAGEVDMLYDVDTIDLQTLQDDSNVEVQIADSVNLWFIWLNNNVAPFDNVLVRKAINAAIDKDSIVEVAMNGLGTPGVSQAPMGLLGSTEENADTYDVEKAKAYLEESGVDPSTIEFPIICSSDLKKRMAEVIQANLAEIGIDSEIVSMEYATYLETTASGDFTAAISGFAQKSMEIFLRGIFHSDSMGAINRSFFGDPEIDALIDQASVTLDDTEREAILKEAVAKINDACPQIPLLQDTWIRAYNKDLGGISVNPAGIMYYNTLYWK